MKTFNILLLKIKTANQTKLSGVARQLYLQGKVGLGKAQMVAQSGNHGKGFQLATTIAEPREEKK